MKIVPTRLDAVVVVIPAQFSDDRGYFSETWNARRMEEAGLGVSFVQDNHSYSAVKGTVRGLHFQAPPHAQDKLVRVARGRIIDVAVDIRRGAATYGAWVAEELSAANGRQLLIPKGFLHGFATLEDDTEVLYKVSDFYASDTEGSIRFDDPDLAVDWRLGGQKALLSDKDAAAGSFSDFVSPFVYEGGT